MTTPVRTVAELRARVSSDPTLKAALQADPEAELARLDRAPVPDTGVYRIVVGSLGLVVLACVGGAIYLAGLTPARPIPEILLALGSASVGALAGILAPNAMQP
ncbi:MAG TPA: hypothetical protein VM076_09700 [Gemmatimonadaceae bacterium]|nr:hypothetical protein [Gemmatimonadaceae bacterium]